ncbi:hypothetical protein IWW38_005924, partial [Coemansia aciculifera]
MDETSVGVIAAVCVCIALTAIAVGLRLWFARGKPGLCGRRLGRSTSTSTTSWLQAYQRQPHGSKECDIDGDSIHNMSLETALDKLEGKAAQRNYAYACQYAERHQIDEGKARLRSRELELIAEHGASAWQFEVSDANDGVSVHDGTEIEFAGGEQLLVANLQFPNEQHVYYYE